MFDGVKERMQLKLVDTLAFGNGKVVLTYESARSKKNELKNTNRRKHGALR